MTTSEIIQKEKELQKEYMICLGIKSGCDVKLKKPKLVLFSLDYYHGLVNPHKQSLINLKEYLEGFKKKLRRNQFEMGMLCDTGEGYTTINDYLVILRADIEELNKMIKVYDDIS